MKRISIGAAPRGSGYRLLLTRSILCLTLFSLVAVCGQAATITLANGVTNPAGSIISTVNSVEQQALGDTATLVSTAAFAPILQATLNAQGFTAGNNWSLVTDQLTLPNNATFNITEYDLFLFVAPAVLGFGEDRDFMLNPNLAGPANPPAGSTVTEHWLQVLNENQQYGGFGYPIAGQPGFWQVDNGDVAGGAAAGAGSGPYYDSNSGGGFSVPPGFHDLPHIYSGIGTYLHFDVFPAWDIFTPADKDTPATETIDVGDVGLAWGFTIVSAPVPEPSTWVLLAIGLVFAGSACRLRKG